MISVRCEHPDGGDAIEGRAAPVASTHATLWLAECAARRWYRTGPNGPVRTADIYDDADGQRVNPAVTLGPPVPVRIVLTRHYDGWWSAAAHTPDGHAIAASRGVCVNREAAAEQAHHWASYGSGGRYEIVAETPA